MKARSKRKREAARTFTDGKRRDNPLPLGKLRTAQPAPKPTNAISLMPSEPKPTSEKQNLSMHRFPCKPWHKCDSIVPPHRERRIARAIGRFAQAVAA